MPPQARSLPKSAAVGARSACQQVIVSMVLLPAARSTRNAAFFSNFTVVTIHAHQWTIDPSDPKGGLAGETPSPPDFLIELAHDAIDDRQTES